MSDNNLQLSASIANRGGLYLQGISHLQGAAERAFKRNSMAIRNVLNPLDEDIGSFKQACSVKSAGSFQTATAGSSLSIKANPKTGLAYRSPQAPSWPSTPARLTPGSSEPTTRRSTPDIHGMSALTTGALTPASQTPGLSEGKSRDLTPAGTVGPETPPSIDGGPLLALDQLESKHSKVDLPLENRRNRPNKTAQTSRKPYHHPYDYEQDMFIWFFTTDVPLDREEVPGGLLDKFTKQWPGSKRSMQGLLCKLYRLPGRYSIPKRRSQKVGGHISASQYGMWAMRRHKYRWMDEYAQDLPGYDDAEYEEDKQSSPALVDRHVQPMEVDDRNA